MKKFFVILVVISLMAVGGGIFFFSTFDADEYRPLVIEKLESALGVPLELERISLAWRGGAALELDDLTLYQDPAGQQVLVTLESARILVPLMPLLAGQLQITSIVLDKPALTLVRGADGKIKVISNENKSTSEISSKTQSKSKLGGEGAAILPFMINKVEIEDALIRYRDETAAQPMDMLLENVDLKLKNVSLRQMISFDGRASFAAPTQNLDFSGKFKFLIKQQSAELRDLKVAADLDALNENTLMKFFPPIKQAGLNNIEGKVSVLIPSIQLASSGAPLIKGEVGIDGGLVELQTIAQPIRVTESRIYFQGDRIQIDRLSGQIGSGKIEGQGRVESFSTQPLIIFNANVADFDLKEILAKPKPGDPTLEGILSADFSGTAAVAQQVVFNGQGKVQLEQGVIRNLNILQEVFGRISMVPGLSQRLRSRLSEEYQKKFEAPDTYLETLDLPIQAQNGTFFVQGANIQTDSFQLVGDGSLDLNNNLSGAFMLSMDPDLSNAFIRSVEELAYLNDSQGRMQIPLTLRGSVSKPQILPNLQYVASKLAVAKAQDLIGSLFRKEEPAQQNQEAEVSDTAATDTSSQAQAAVPQQSGTQERRPRGLLGQLLEVALESQASQNQPQNTQ